MDVTCALHPPVGPPPRTLVLRNLAPSIGRNICATCQDDVPWHGHIHELLHQLRIPERRVPRGLVHSDLGHFDNLLENKQRGVEEHKNLHQLSHHLRYRSIEHRQGHNVDGLLHDAPLNPLLRTRHVGHTVWSGATDGKHLAKNVHGKVLGACRLGSGGPPDRRRVVQLASPTPWPWPSSVRQGLGDRLLLVPPGSTQSSPSPTLSSSCHGLPARVHRPKQVTHKEKWARLGKTPNCCGCCVLWALRLLRLLWLLWLFQTRAKGSQQVYVHSSLLSNWHGEPSMTKNSSSSRARKLALHSGTTRRSAKNAEKPPRIPSIPTNRLKATVCTVGTSLCAEQECMQSLAMN